MSKYAAILILALWVGAWVWFSDSIPRTIHWAHESLVHKSAALGFTVENILVEGRVNSDHKALLSHLGAKAGDPLLAFNPEQAQVKIGKLPWIRHVSIQRRLPNTLYINIEERLPIGLLQRNGSIHIIDEQGKIIPDPNITPFTNLPLFRGKDALDHAPELTALLLATPDLHQRIKTATRISNRRWDLTLRNDIVVRLPEEDIGLALKRLNDAQAQEQLLDHNLLSIDLRDPKRMTIRAKPGEAHDYEEKTKDAPAV